MGKNKMTALYGVIKFGDATVIPAISNRVKQLVSKRRKIQMNTEDNKTELIIAMEFLERYMDTSDEPEKLLNLIATTKFDFLWENEREWVNGRQNKLKGHKQN